MPKINLKISINGQLENLTTETIAFKTKNKIVYKENNVNVIINLYKNKIIINRSCNEYEIKLVLDKTKKTLSSYKLFNSSKLFYLDTITNELLIEENKICINYNIEGNDFNFNLEVI